MEELPCICQATHHFSIQLVQLLLLPFSSVIELPQRLHEKPLNWIYCGLIGLTRRPAAEGLNLCSGSVHKDRSVQCCTLDQRYCSSFFTIAISYHSNPESSSEPFFDRAGAVVRQCELCFDPPPESAIMQTCSHQVQVLLRCDERQQTLLLNC